MSKIILNITIFFTILWFNKLIAQTPEQRIQITKDYDRLSLAQQIEKSQEDYEVMQLRIAQYIDSLHITKNYTDSNGNFVELVGFYADGQPKYYTTHNKIAARSTRTNFLHQGGGMGLNLTGENGAVYVWDGGHVRASHQEFSDGIGGATRVTVMDATTPSLGDHATHVAGTISAYGANVNAKGMAPKAQIKSYDWNNDITEAMTAAANGMLLSNHSYGDILENITDWKIGAYTIDARRWDHLMYQTPFFLMVVSAGNNGWDNSSNASPLSGNANFDKLTGHSLCKNNLVVANGLDLSVNATTGNPTGSPSINTSSSEGPSDDFRVKPDITGNGTGVFSSISTSNTAYDSYDGTSMASPNVAGSLLLLQELYQNLHSTYMYAATLKGLALHTADDGGLTGPDAIFGWGYLNIKKAAETLIQDGTTSEVEELTLSNGEVQHYSVVSDGTNPLKVSISWTDLPANNINIGPNANSTTPVLVNDLDIRLTKDGIDYYPWKLTGVNTNAKADNITDNFERIDINSASGTYFLTVSHKNTLPNPQRFSLIATGISDFSLGNDKIVHQIHSIYPNPNQGNFEITCKETGEYHISIFNSIGLKVYESKTLTHQFSHKIDLTGCSKGIYWVQIIKENRIVTHKIMIE